MDSDSEYERIEEAMALALGLYEAKGGSKSFHEIITQIDPPPDVAVSRALMGIADDLEPPSDAPTRGNKGASIHNSAPGGGNLRLLWQQLQRDRCQFAGANVICARVFPTAEEGAYWLPDKESLSERFRVYKVERGVEMCLGVKNFMTKAITVEPFFVDTEEKEASEGPQVLSPLGQSQLKLKSELGDGETRDGWRLKDVSGEVIVTVYLEVGA